MSKLAARLGTAAFVIALPAVAADANVDVRANIKGICTITSSGVVINFGDIEQAATGATDKTQNAALNFWCTKGLVYSVTINNGQNFLTTRRMKGTDATNTTEFLPYELSSTSPATGTGAGPAVAATLTLTGTVKASDYNTLSVGNLQDTIVVTIAP